MKLALCQIVKGNDDEAELFERCVKSLGDSVDKVFVTFTHKKGETPYDPEYITEKIVVSNFEWANDFSAARNFNFSQVPKDFDYILWCDADDIWQNPKGLRKLIENNPTVDAFAFWYYYAFDEHKNPSVVHKKTQIIRNDGCAQWVGRIHEDLLETRALILKFVEGIERIHLSSSDRSIESQRRNVEIAEEELVAKPEDPKSYFNLGNSYLGVGDAQKAQEAFTKFIQSTGSDDEKYLAYQRLSMVENALGNREKAVECLLIAIGLFPELPDAYNNLGYLYFNLNLFDKAEKYLLIGLQMKPQYHKMIVYNPRDYDYNPMMALAKVYFNKTRPDYALPMLRGCAQIYPKDKYIQGLIEEMENELERLKTVIEAVISIEAIGDKQQIKHAIEKLPQDLQSHPSICRIRNKWFTKTVSSGKDIAYYCGETNFDWNPDLFKTKGFGGSEEAVINLTKQWAKAGYSVTVYNSCGIETMERDGVTYKPFWHFNSNDKYDHIIFWRTPRLVDHDINCKNIYIDLHDVVSPGEFNEKRLNKIKKIFVKTQAHRVLFPNIPDNKIAIVPNGMDFGLFDQDIKKDPYLLVNTSSPDRSLDVLPGLFKEIKARVPQARLKWAYGWDNFDNAFKNDKEKMAWKSSVIREMAEAGIEDCGRLSQRECAKLYLEGAILAYPSDFYEIDCISVKKAQACGCVPITTDFAAMKESNKFGSLIPSKKTIKNWSKPYQFTFGIQDRKVQEEWVDYVVMELMQPSSPELVADMKAWSKTFDWDGIAARWAEIFTNA